MILDDKLRVYASNKQTSFACQYYRLQIPLAQFEKAGYAVTWYDNGDQGPQDSAAAMSRADFDVFWCPTPHQLGMFQNIVGMKSGLLDGKFHLSPTLVIDVDDNRDYMHPHNPPGFVTQGVRGYPDTSLLQPGQTLYSPDGDGKPHPLWVDKETYYSGIVFDIERNLTAMRLTHQMHRLAHAMTTPSPHLSRYLHEAIGVKYVHTFPNTIIPEDYVSYPLVRKDKRVRILWQGGCSHDVDWYPLRHALKDVAAKHKDAVFVIFGEMIGWVADYIPAEQLEWHPWVDYAAYKMKRALLNVDINLCPLAKNLFNICKSAIKWYEGSVWDTPEGTLAADVPPYSDEMVDGETGLLYKDPKEFAEKLSLLIENAQLRTRLGQAAKRWVLENRTPEQTIPPLWEFYNEVRDRRVGEYLMAQGASKSEIKRLAAQAGIR